MVRNQLMKTAAVLACAAAALVSVGGPAAAATKDVSVNATIDGHDLSRSNRSHPVPLQDDQPAAVALRVANRGSQEVTVRSVRVQGRAVGLTLFSYEARVDLRVAPGTTEQLAYGLELVDLPKQAVGLVPGRLQVLDENRKVIGTQSFSADVRGSLLSVYGVFGLAVAGITIVLLVGAFARLARHRLPANRARRGLRFATAGVGIGLTLTFTVSALRLALPAPGLWVTLILLCGGAMFAFGYLTPDGDSDEAGDGAAGDVGQDALVGRSR